jgi:hypothetical protein
VSDRSAFRPKDFGSNPIASTRNRKARHTHSMASYFRLSGNELDLSPKLPCPVQTAAETTLKLATFCDNLLCCYDFLSSNPVVTLGQMHLHGKSLGQAVEQLKRRSGIGLFMAGVKLPLALAELRLIDQSEFIVHPRLVGLTGRRCSQGLSKHIDLRLVSRLEFASGRWRCGNSGERGNGGCRLICSHRYLPG